jgi:hypothetical protein
MTGDNPLPDGITANPDDDEVVLMIPTAEANTERRGVILSRDEALVVAQDIIDAVDATIPDNIDEMADLVEELQEGGIDAVEPIRDPDDRVVDEAGADE